MREKTGRSYRRSSSRDAASFPARASAPTSWSERGSRSFPCAMGRVIYAPHARPTEPPLLMAAPTLEPSPVDSQDKRSYVRGIFSDIAPRYDLLNRLLSFRIDQLWRRAAVKRLGWEARPNGTYLDACAGTLDLSMALAGQPGFLGHVIGTDFAVPMLQ